MSRSEGQVVVVKIGGSILRDARAYAEAARFVECRLRAQANDRFVFVVSAEHGTTDALEETARAIAPVPSARSLDLLWSLGELRSVALLVLHLERRGVPAVDLNVHETGLKIEGGRDTAGVAVEGELVWRELGEGQAVVVPGFLATNRSGSIVSLGRGGSDLTTVLLAIHLGAESCELVKDVGGYFTADPRRSVAAEPLRALTFKQALHMADEGCELVQREALAAAWEAGLPIEIRGLSDGCRRTAIGRVDRTSTVEAESAAPKVAKLVRRRL